MQCPEPTELTRAHLDRGDDAMQAHLARCERCSAEWKELELIAELAREMAWQRPRPDQVGGMRAQVVASLAPRPIRRRTTLFVGVGVALAAAAALVLWLGRDPAPAPDTYAGAVRPLPRADYALFAPGPDEQVRLWNGTIAVEVDRLAAGERFRVITGDAEVEVRGTAFEVVADNDRLVAVRVTHGRVEIRSQGAAPVSVAAGERWEMTLPAPEPAVPDPIEPEPEPEPDPDPQPETAELAVTPPAALAVPERPKTKTRRSTPRGEPVAATTPAPTPAPTPDPVPAVTVPAAVDPAVPAQSRTPPATIASEPVRPAATVPAGPERPTAPTPTASTPPATQPGNAATDDRRQDRRDELREQRRDDRRTERRDERRRDRRDDRRKRGR